MNFLVTGGAGFIGSNFIRYLLKNYTDMQVVNFDKLTYCGNLANLKDVEENPCYTFVQGDICDSQAVQQVMQETDILVNFAAESHVDRSIEGPEIFTHNNVIGTHVLLEAARKSAIKKFIQISTDEVYGSITEGLFTEQSTFAPNSPYSASKAGADLLARSYHKTYGLPIIITRSSNNFGPFQYPEKIIPLFITNLLQAKKVPVYGNGLNVRDWIFVKDNCEGIDAAMRKGKIGEAYNIGGENEITNLDLTKNILSEMGKDESFIEFVTDRPGHDKRYAVDCSKIKELGWKPKHDFNEALKKTIQWYKDTISWWEPLKK